MEIGTVISSKDGLFVVTKTENGYIAETKRIQDYFAEVIVVECDGEFRTIKEILETRIDLYLATHEVVQEK